MGSILIPRYQKLLMISFQVVKMAKIELKQT